MINRRAFTSNSGRIMQLASVVLACSLSAITLEIESELADRPDSMPDSRPESVASTRPGYQDLMVELLTEAAIQARGMHPDDFMLMTRELSDFDLG